MFYSFRSGWVKHATACTQSSDDSVWPVRLSFHDVDSRD